MLRPVAIRLSAFLLFCAVCSWGADRPPRAPLSGKLVLFHAGSLAVPLRAVSRLFEARHPGVKVEAEAAGSRDSARKVSDLGRACDVMALADYRVAEELLVPKHADFNISFAANEMAIAYSTRSRHADSITAENWPRILLREDAAFGRADPDRDPCGYRTEMLFQLAQRHYRTPGLSAKLLAKDRRYIRPKETDLLGLLEAGEIDYLFIYRSVVEQHGLKMVALPREVNLGSPDLDKLYRSAQVRIAGARPGESTVLRGEPIVYSVTIPRSAPNRAAAEAYVALLLSPEGQAVMAENGQQPIRPARVDRMGKLPPSLKPFCRKGGKP